MGGGGGTPWMIRIRHPWGGRVLQHDLNLWEEVIFTILRLTPSFTIPNYLDGEVLAWITEGGDLGRLLLLGLGLRSIPVVSWADQSSEDRLTPSHQSRSQSIRASSRNEIAFTPIKVTAGSFKIKQTKLMAGKVRKEITKREEKIFPDTIVRHTTITDSPLRLLSYYLPPSVTWHVDIPKSGYLAFNLGSAH